MIKLITVLTLTAVTLSPINSLAEPTTVSGVWNKYKKNCPTAYRSWGTFAFTKNFHISICNKNENQYLYIGRHKKSGSKVIVPNNKEGRFLKGDYEYKFDRDRSGVCNLQALKNGKVILKEPIEENMFMSDICMYWYS